jgi:hypothetical protein
MIIFPNAPALRPQNNDCWLLEEDFACMHKGKMITLKKGFWTDGASIPRFAWRLVGHPFSMPVLPCALIHDALYAGELVERSKADMIFLELMKKAKVSRIKRNIIYVAVRLGGGIPWARHKIDGILEARKYCTIQRV